MRTRPGGQQAASVLLPIVVLAALALLVLASMVHWSSTQAKLADRWSQWQGAAAMAESGAEKVIAKMTRDFLQGGPTVLDANLGAYSQLLPTELTSLSNVSGLGAFGSPILVERLSSWLFSDLSATMPGLRGQAATYRVTARTTGLTPAGQPAAGIAQDLQFASLPVFQFGSFYGLDLEIAPWENWTAPGRVHSNGNVYCDPNDCRLTFAGTLTSARQILLQRHPLDPVVRVPGRVVFNAEHLSGVKTLTLPLGTNNAPDAAAALLDIPPAGEPTDSTLGQQRYYNKAELIIRVQDSTPRAHSGAYNNFSTVIPWSQVLKPVPPAKGPGFVETNVYFFDKREGQMLLITQLDLDAFLNNKSYFASVLGRNVLTLYVADERSGAAGLPAVRLINGGTMPVEGLTIATANPLYVLGDFNLRNLSGGRVRTGRASAALAADAVTILSDNWRDSDSTFPLASRQASSTTINAALLTGIVPTTAGYFSGGLENSLRLLEDWTGRTLTFRGSMVVSFPCRKATAPWGATPEVYAPPTRSWSSDSRFQTQSTLPPGTPQVRACFRGRWTMVAPQTE